MGYIHGGLSGALCGAWDLILGYADEATVEKFILSYKRGKFIEKLYGKFNVQYLKGEDAMKRAIALKYQTFISRRKYQFICKIQKNAFDTEKQELTKNIITYGDYNINLKTAAISNNSVDQFVKSLDIGDINPIPSISGVSTTVIGLTTLMNDVNLRVKSLRENLIWFNGNPNHFIIQFSDDGAP